MFQTPFSFFVKTSVSRKAINKGNSISNSQGLTYLLYHPNRYSHNWVEHIISDIGVWISVGCLHPASVQILISREGISNHSDTISSAERE